MNYRVLGQVNAFELTKLWSQMSLIWGTYNQSLILFTYMKKYSQCSWLQVSQFELLFFPHKPFLSFLYALFHRDKNALLVHSALITHGKLSDHFLRRDAYPFGLPRIGSYIHGTIFSVLRCRCTRIASTWASLLAWGLRLEQLYMLDVPRIDHHWIRVALLRCARIMHSFCKNGSYEC